MTTTRQSEIYDVTAKTICQWKNDGIKAGIEAPLDHPDQMPAWWEKMRAAGKFEKSCPVKLLRAAGMTPKPQDDEDREPVDFGTAGKKRDYAATLELAERNVDAVQAIFDRAISSGDDTGLIALQKMLNDAVDSHRALMRDRGKIQAEAGETLPKAEVRAAMLEIHGTIQQRFRRAFKSVFPVLEDFKTPEAWNVFVDEKTDEICEGLRTSGFAD